MKKQVNKKQLARVYVFVAVLVCAVALSGTGAAYAENLGISNPSIVWEDGSHGSYDFGDVPLGESRTATFRLESLGPSSVWLYVIALTSSNTIGALGDIANPNDHINPRNCLGSFCFDPDTYPILPQEMTAGRFYMLDVIFAPLSLGEQNVFLYVHSNDALSPPGPYAFIRLKGTSVGGHTITASGGANGTFAPSGAMDVAHNATQTFTATPGGGYQPVMSGTCGGTLNGTSYITYPITQDCTVTATFIPTSSTPALPAGENVQIQVAVPLPGGGTAVVTVTFEQIDTAGNLTVTATDTPTGGGAPGGFSFLGTYYDVSFTGTFSGAVYITFPYDDSSIPAGGENNLRLFHWEGRWVDVIYALDTVNNRITGRVTSLSPFGIGYYVGSGGGYTTGANTSLIALIAFLAFSAGLFILRKKRWSTK